MQPKVKRAKLFDKKSVEEINSCLYKILYNGDYAFLKRIDLEYDIWCMSLSSFFKYIVSLIDDYRKAELQVKDELIIIIKNELNDFLNQLFTFILYLAIDSNSQEERFLKPEDLFESNDNFSVIRKLTEIIKTYQPDKKNLKIKLESLKFLTGMFEVLTVKCNHKDLKTHEHAQFIHYSVQFSNLALKLNSYEKTNYTLLLEDSGSKVLNDDDDDDDDQSSCFITNLKSHINVTLSLFYKLENMHAKLTNEPIKYKNFLSMANKLFKNAQYSIEFYEKFQTDKQLDFKNFNKENYTSALATERYFNKILSELTSSDKHKHVHPYLKLNFINEKYDLDCELSAAAHEKLAQDFKAFLYIAKLLQYSNSLAHILDCNRDELSLDDFKIILKQYSIYTTYMVRCFIENLIELLLNVRTNTDNSFDFMLKFNQNVRSEILNYNNNMCKLNGNTNINKYLDVAKLVFNFANFVIKNDGAKNKCDRPLKTNELENGKKFLSNLSKRVIKLIRKIDSNFLSGAKTLKLDGAKMLKRKIETTNNGEVKFEFEVIKSYLDILINLFFKLNQFQQTKIKDPQLNLVNFCEFLFKCASLLSAACVKAYELFCNKDKKSNLNLFK